MTTLSGTNIGAGSAVNAVKIFACGSTLMILGIAIGKEMAQQPSDGTMVAFARGREIVPLVPIVVGALLTFWGGIRMSLAMRRLHLLLLGPTLLLGAYEGSFLAAQLFPEIGGRGSNGALALPLFTHGIVGVGLFLTALLRLLRTNDKT